MLLISYQVRKSPQVSRYLVLHSRTLLVLEEESSSGGRGERGEVAERGIVTTK